MLAFTETLKTKKQAVALAMKHQKADSYIQGSFWNASEKKGCSVGCMVKDYTKNHVVSWQEAI